MSLIYVPDAGTIIQCDFSKGFEPPEMVKKRPVIVVSPPIHNRRDLCTVVPMSTTEPHQMMKYHYEMTFDPPLPYPYDKERFWVKCDMIYSVGIGRLDFLYKKNENGSRNYDKRIVSKADLDIIRRCLVMSIGL
jgi:uncharacterized protein YifN (PemK superfamily)